ncbi:MAG TPA: hypothetical protein VFC73_00520 [Syntrophomonadaceae bacterium]|nr:hypothetical protein [Syntrophomonadaceae bacterium]
MVRKLAVTFFIFIMLTISGCDEPISNIIPSKDNKPGEDLIKVEITFTDQKSLVGHIKELGIEQQHGRVYIGGSSLNYLYNAKGDVIGAYNYQRVLYIKILPVEKQTDD